MREKNTYTAPAVIASTDAVQSTKDLVNIPTDGDAPGQSQAPGAVGFSL